MKFDKNIEEKNSNLTLFYEYDSIKYIYYSTFWDNRWFTIFPFKDRKNRF